MQVKLKVHSVVVVFLLTLGWIAGFFSGAAVGYDRRSEELRAWKRQVSICVVEVEKQRQILVSVFRKPVRLQ